MKFNAKFILLLLIAIFSIISLTSAYCLFEGNQCIDDFSCPPPECCK